MRGTMSWIIRLFFISSSLCLMGAEKLDTPEYQFIGRHFVASYSGCDRKALTNLDALAQALEGASIASGAHILKSTKHVFPPDGLTMVILLSESHASIHTYPEHDSCFVDLFTCGTTCSAEKFDESLRHYLKPTKVNSQIFKRE